MTETHKIRTNELLVASQRNCLKNLQATSLKSDELASAIHQEMKGGTADRKYLLEKVLNALDEAKKSKKVYHQKLTVLDYHIRQALQSGV
ncbi:hypothetical protein DIX90_09860 [Streptococcus iniae]|uniref:hypothetical protein n=1 Tax=Streptococcus iniae TaxID=1346 RepID=UPI000EF64D76|nr:hypothetical protein [Streptococcus iniae]RLU51370.1 hypothetical protein DIY04_10885 [Streptococcus iniae]RLU59986.1 hypothetical protein DIY01_09895 [Streptococcus iniae]RLU62797.1 hypothetical protein DIY02_01520 [Streptococcus iniae]RLU72523.1 hypothetical protein DIX97_01525 [Streptococcus iniae]RLU82202.1 hypothetical protein DIX91_09870 [Streptococcus iniae]